MSARSALLTLLALGPLACAGGPPESPDVGWPDAGVEAPDAGRDGSSPDAAEPPPEGRALFTTALGDDGRLYEVDLATREVTLLASFRQPTSTMTGGQRGVHVAPEVPGTVYLYGGERIERYRWGAWDAPQTRWSVAHGRALTGVELCDGRLFVALGPPLDWMSPTSASALLAFDPTTGAPAGEIDLSALLPGERPLVVASLVQIGLVLYVSLFRGGDGLPAEPLGRIAAIECSPGAMGRILTWDVAPGATLHARAGLSPNVWVVTPEGLYQLSPLDELHQLRGPYLTDLVAETVSLADVAVGPAGRLALAEHLYPGMGTVFSARGACASTSDWSHVETETLACTALSSLVVAGAEVWALAAPCLREGPGTRIFRWRLDDCGSLGTLDVDGYFPVSMALP